MKRVIEMLDRVHGLADLWRRTLGRREAIVVLAAAQAQFVVRDVQVALVSQCCLSSGCFATKGGHARTFLEMPACFAICFQGRARTEAGEDGSKRLVGEAIA